MRFAIVHISFFLVTLSVAQGVGVGTDAPHASSIMEVRASNNKGVLINRLTTTEIGSISSPAQGLLIFDTSKQKMVYFNGSSWVELSVVPSGTIIMWSGAISAIPKGWVLCDGGFYDINGQKKTSTSFIKTPDLRGRFVVGYDRNDGDYNNPGSDTGGSASVLLSVNQLPAHNHSINSNHNHSISITNSAHKHTLTFQRRYYRFNAGFIMTSGSTGYLFSMQIGLEETGDKSLQVNVSSSTTGVSVSNSGNSETHENRPPFYVLAYLMKL